MPKTRNKNELNQSIFPPSTLLDTTITRISQLITDTGATGTIMEKNAPYITNIKEADLGIDVLYPNNQFLTSMHTADIIFDHIPPNDIGSPISYIGVRFASIY